MKAIQPEDQGYWLLTKGSTLYWQENDLPSEQQRNSASQCKSNVAREMESQPLWLMAENEQDEREYSFLTKFVVLTD